MVRAHSAVLFASFRKARHSTNGRQRSKDPAKTSRIPRMRTIMGSPYSMRHWDQSPRCAFRDVTNTRRASSINSASWSAKETY